MARKILLADDSVTAQNMGRKILADAGYEVIAVNNGSAALKKIAELKPDLVILDVYMPGYSGLEVCQRLKESQETSRIPVLLTVGKLEPFKPEEAQRVRAEGYIVKPFEASELLSALSKLEDKVVPRSEPSKPGRFARAIASVEESARGRSENTSEQNGWKSRIGFPHEKPEAAEKPADDSAIYNPMNRDLRTVVEPAGEKIVTAASRKPEIGQKEAAHQSDVASIDVGALAPAGLPQDVTPEEVAAIAAAAAQIRMANAVGREQSQIEEREVLVEEARVENAAIVQDAAPLSELASVAAPPAVSAAQETSEAPQNENQPHEEPQEDEPVSMAVTADSVAAVSASRWTAVPVALEAAETNISLEQEMQKAYAAYVAAEAETVAAAKSSSPVIQTEAAAAEPCHQESGVPQVLEPVTEASSPDVTGALPEQSVVEPAPVEQTLVERTTNEQAGSLEAIPQEFNVSEAAVASTQSAFEERAGISQAEGCESSISATAKITQQASESDPVRVAEFMTPVSEAEVAGLAGLVGLSAELQQPVTQEESLPAEAAATRHAFAPLPRTDNVTAEGSVTAQPEPVADLKPESEAVKSTAAAWATWRQIRDISKVNETTSPQAKEKDIEIPEFASTDTAARAVAAGAEQTVPETSSISVTNNSTDVASIVDSVLADLRPKLMAEISRKMAEKK